MVQLLIRIFVAKKQQMRQTRFEIIATLVILVMTGATHLIGKPKHTGMQLKSSLMTRNCLTTTEKVIIKDQIELPQEELDYYLERHNVQDEGFEMVVAIANGKRHQVTLSPHLTVRSVGFWEDYKRDGTIFVCDSLGRTIAGTWNADTLESGIRIDTQGTYFGDFSETKPNGHGAYLHTNCSYFEGHWSDGKRDGFGVELLAQGDEPSRLRMGIWNHDRFMGERMKYTTERIYGIDIARYQHGKGRRPLPILWNKLRITHVGKRGSHNVSGTADYPVSFVFIKSTESTTVRNKYYQGDYQHAHRQGIRTGAYHFWSTRTSGEEQARFFLKNTRFSKGDLPPVLDLEPSDKQIETSGGVERMFRHVRVWLRLVEQQTGVKPILYVNQMFVNKYLSGQPDLKRDYRVWIARYSEYKPDVRLSFWQLCPDGRVSGITGDVDINVFNGYKSQFEAFLEQETIR